MASYKLKLTLKDSKPPIDRTLGVPKDITFEDLAKAVDAAMLWSADEPHHFSFHRGRFIVVQADFADLELRDVADERDTELSEFEGERFAYIHGSANWTVDITFQKDVKLDPDVPTLLKIRGVSPPDDSGGLHAYYASMGQDSYSDGWEGFREEADDGYVIVVREALARWTRSDPMSEGILGVDSMNAVMNALLDPSAEFVLDRERMKVLRVGDGKRGVTPEEVEDGPARYVPVHPVSKDFPYVANQRIREIPEYEGEVGDAAAYSEYVSGIKGEDKVRFDRAMSVLAMKEMESWARLHRIRCDNDNFLLLNPEILGYKTMTSFLNTLQNLSAQMKDRDAKYQEILCPRCGTPNHGKIDKRREPTIIAGVERYPLVIVCNGCGASTALKMMNDGYNLGYTYPGTKHPADQLRGAVIAATAESSENDPEKKRRANLDSAVAWIRHLEFDNAAKSLSRYRREAAGGGRRGPKPSAQETVEATALGCILWDRSSEQKTAWRSLRRHTGELSGPFGAVLLSDYCKEARSPDLRRSMYEKTVEACRGLDRGDILVDLALYQACLRLYDSEDEGDWPRAARDLMALTRELADLVEPDYGSFAMKMFSQCYHMSLRMCSDLGTVDRAFAEEGLALAREMRERFFGELDGRIDPHGGLLAVVVYGEAIMTLQATGDEEAVTAMLRRIEDVGELSMDNGPFTMDRMLCCIAADRNEDGRGVGIDVALNTAVAMGNTDAIYDLCSLYVARHADIMSPQRISGVLMGCGIQMSPQMVETLAAGTDPVHAMWCEDTIRPQFRRCYNGAPEWSGRLI